MCVLKALESEILEVRAECGSIVREIVLAIDDSI